MRYELTIPGKPFGKEEKRVVRRGAYVSSYLPQHSRDYMNDIKLLWNSKYPNHKLLTGPVNLHITAYMPIPKATSKKALLLMYTYDTYHTKRPDASNIIKLVEDGLTGCAWVDDSQVMPYCVKFYSDTPRVELVIQPLDKSNGMETS